MADATTCRPLKRSYVALTEKLHKMVDQENSVVVGNCVAENAITRSGLLSGLEDTEGLASLPSHISATDFRLWEMACFADVEFPLEELVTVLKVADALCDTNITAWVKKLTALVAKTDWEYAKEENAMLCALLHLPPHLLHQTINQYFDSHEPLSAALETLPQALHAAAVSAAAATGDLSFSHRSARSVLLTLPFVTVPGPGLQRIHAQPDAETTATATHSPFASTASAALLGRAVSTHPSLTHLNINGPPLPPQWLRSFTSCLAPGALPHLVHLTVSADAHPGGCAELAACVRLLPSLTSLDVSFGVPAHATPTAVSLSAYAHLAATPASLPRLQRLTYRDGSARMYRCMGSTAPWPLQRSTAASCCSLFLSLLHMPALKEARFQLLTSFKINALLSYLTQAKSLEKLCVTAPHLPPQQLPMRPPQAVPQFEFLAEFTASCPFPADIAAFAAQMARSSLKSLSVCQEGGAQTHDPATAPHIDHGWKRFLSVLCQATGLERLHMPCLPETSPSSQAEFSRGLAAALMQLPRLEYLCLVPIPKHSVRLNAHLLSHAISRLTALQKLALSSGLGSLVVEPAQQLVAACGKLPLKTLYFAQEGVTGAHVDGVLAQLPALQHMHLQKRFFAASGEEIEALKARFPSVVFVPS